MQNSDIYVSGNKNASSPQWYKDKLNHVCEELQVLDK